MSVSASQPLRVRFATILLAMKARVIAKGVVPPNAVQIIARDQPQSTTAPHLVYIRPRRQIPDQGKYDAAGRLDLELVRQVDIFLDNRLSLDPVNSDEIWLTSIGASYFDLEEDCLTALQGFTPQDASGNNLVVYPIRESSGAGPAKDAVRLGWGRANLTFEVRYMPPLNIFDITPDSIPNGVAGSAYIQSFNASPGDNIPFSTPGSITWFVVSGSTPPGLILNSARGVGELFGTPITAGQYAFGVQATDPTTGFSGIHRYFLIVSIAISPAVLPNGRHGHAYSQQLTAVGAVGAPAFRVSAGTLPPGLTLTSAGLLAGTAT